MKYKIFLIISLFCSILPFENIYGIENKILFKIDNEIITSLDLLDEINYIKTTNNKLKNIKDNQIYEISKNSLIREKIKEIENRKNLKDINIDQDYLNNFLVNYFKTLGISSVNELNEYFNNRDIDPEKVKKKIITEMLWNQMIYMKFSKKINIDRDLIKKDIVNKKKQKEFLLSEIMFETKTKEELNEKFKLIKKTIKEKNFYEAALIHSMSDSSKSGGKLGWIKATSINKNIKNKILNISKDSYTNPIVIPGGFLILYVEDIRETENEIDLKKELQLIVKEKTNSQLNQFSNIYYNKIKKDVQINEY